MEEGTRLRPPRPSSHGRGHNLPRLKPEGSWSDLQKDIPGASSAAGKGAGGAAPGRDPEQQRLGVHGGGGSSPPWGLWAAGSGLLCRSYLRVCYYGGLNSPRSQGLLEQHVSGRSWNGRR